MMASLDVLVVDDRPDTVRFLTEFLIQRCRRVDVAASVKEAMTAVTRRKAAGERYHLVISDFVMPEADGLALLRELRGRQDDVAFVFATGYRTLNPAFEPEAKRLGAVAILDKPIDLRQVEEILNRTTSTFRKAREEKQGEQPFFGTSRMYRRPVDQAPPPPPPASTSDALERRVPVARPPAAAAEPSALQPKSVTPAPFQLQPPLPPPPPPGNPAPTVPITGYQRRPSGVVRLTTTARIRRSVEPPPPAPGQGGTARLTRNASPQPSTAFTARVRRGVDGTASITRPGGPPTESGRMVSCSMCQRSFMVAAKAEAYTTVCLHCGQLQRIEPA